MKTVYSIIPIVVMLLTLSTGAKIVNPLLFINSSYAAPVGIASYGLTNMHADSGPYKITTNTLFGYAKINSLYSYNASAGDQLNISAWGATLQQNIMLNITANGSAYAYWLQNVIDMNTSNMTYTIVNNVWNATSQNAGLSNATLVGSGNVTGTTATFFNPQNNTYYSYGTNSTPYAYPLYFEPIIRLADNHGYPYVQFGYFDNGLPVFYDNITFLIPNGKAALVVTPYNQTGTVPNSNSSGQFYDAEFVFGGEANGATTTFEKMDSMLWLGYLAGNGTISAFPAVGTFGIDTEENATNLSVVQDGGYALVKTGMANYNGTLALSGIPPGITLLPPPVPPTVPTTSIAQTTKLFGNFGIGSGSNILGGVPLYVIITVLILLIYAYFKIREREKNPR